MAESRGTSSITEIAQCRPCWHSVDTNNCITVKEKHKDNSHKASFGNKTVENYNFYIQQQRTRKDNKNKKNNTNKQKVVKRK
jgi:hypothetical protein